MKISYEFDLEFQRHAEFFSYGFADFLDKVVYIGGGSAAFVNDKISVLGRDDCAIPRRSF